jgi:hypothetical protein
MEWKATASRPWGSDDNDRDIDDSGGHNKTKATLMMMLMVMMTAMTWTTMTITDGHSPSAQICCPALNHLTPRAAWKPPELQQALAKCQVAYAKTPPDVVALE